MGEEARQIRLRRPFLVASFGFTFGVLYGPGDLIWVDIAAGLFALVVSRRRKFRVPVMRSVFLWAGCFLLGLTVPALLLPAPERLSAQPGIFAEAGVTLEGTVAETPDHGLLADGLILDVTRPAPGRVMVRLPRSAASTACVEAGARVRVKTVLSPRRPSLVPQFRSRRLAVRRGVQLFGEASGICERLGPDHNLLGILSRRVAQGIQAAAPKHAGLLTTFATGKRPPAATEDARRLERSGLAHLLVMQGLGMAVVLALVLLLVHRILGARDAGSTASRQKTIARLGLLVLVGLIGLYGGTPSTIRSALLIACLLLPALAPGRRRIDSLDALALAVIVVLAVSPAALGDVRFQLPFAALSAVVRLYPAVTRKIPRLAKQPRFVRAPIQLLLLAVVITAGTAPLTARLFDRVTVVSFLVEPLAILIVFLFVTPLSVLGGLLAAAAPSLGQPLLSLAGLGIQGLLTSIPETGTGGIPTPTVLECVLFYAAVSTVAAPPRDPDRPPPRFLTRPRFAALAAFGLILSVGVGLYRRSGRDRLELAVLPTARGHAYVVSLPDGGVVVRDTAPAAAWFQMEQRTVSNFLKLRRHTTIDALVVHPGEDLDAARELAHQFAVDEVWWLALQQHEPLDGPADRLLDRPLTRRGARFGPVSEGLFVEYQGIRLEVTETSTGAVVETENGPTIRSVPYVSTATVPGDVYRTDENGVVRAIIEDGRLEVTPLIE